MFSSEIYSSRRNKLRSKIKSGLLLFPGNKESAYNYRANTYAFRQDSTFLYLFGLDEPDLIGMIDLDENKDSIFGNDPDIEDIIWSGPQPKLSDKALKVGVKNSGTINSLFLILSEASQKGRKVHFTPPYRADTAILLESFLGLHHASVQKYVSVELIKALTDLRSIKEECEIVEIEKMEEVAYDMHTSVMKRAKAGVYEKELTGIIEGIASAYGYGISFPVILSGHGETLHNHHHGNYLKNGDLLICDAGAESELHYASDITRTTPVGGRFSNQQKEIYEIVLNANQQVIKTCKPGIPYTDIHIMAASTIASGLKELGLMHGNIDDAVKNGAHALFFPHGLGHMLGLDVHDMENYGEDLVGYDETIKRSTQFGTAYLRLAKKLQPGFVITDEPGIYFIPELISKWKQEKKFEEFIDYTKVEKYIGFGGIRIEDNLLITSDGCRLLGKPIPKTVAEVEDIMK
jgi:Xaa-Pro aminopeptidase